MSLDVEFRDWGRSLGNLVILALNLDTFLRQALLFLVPAIPGNDANFTRLWDGVQIHLDLACTPSEDYIQCAANCLSLIHI